MVVGSGIRAIGHFSLEAQAYLKWADKVYYCVADPVTEQWMVDQAPDSVDLYTLYDNDKPRRITYVQMAEVMLQSVREGLNVVGVFYGHPGVFVNPSHRAIAIARQEGHAAFMVPAISALDCLFADVGIDPSSRGCQIIEASDLLLRRRPLLVDGHVIILQVGSVGDMGFRFSGFPNSHLADLIHYLQDAYGEDYEIINYTAAQLSIVDPVIELVALSRLLEPEMHATVTGISTFYIPPKTERPIDPDMASALSLVPLAGRGTSVSRGVVPPFEPSGEPYTAQELKYISQLAGHEVPRDYRPSRPSREFYEQIRKLSLDPAILERYRDDRYAVFDTAFSLSDREKTAIWSRNFGRTRAEMQRSEKDVARAFVADAPANATLAVRYHRILSAATARNEPDAVEQARTGLRGLGYDTSPAAISDAFDEFKNELAVWACGYQLVVDGQPGGELIITPRDVSLDRTPLKSIHFAQGVLTWSERDGNSSSASLRFSVPTGSDEQVRPESYIGPQCHGVLWKGGSEPPARDNAYGKVGVYSVAGAADPSAGDPLETWTGIYATHLAASTGVWSEGPDLTVRTEPGKREPELELDGQQVKQWYYANGILAWAQPESSWSGSVTFFQHQHDSTIRRSAFMGRLWRWGSDPGALMLNAVGQRAG